MATQTQTLLVDDIDGSEASSTVTFGISGTTYEIDLSDANLQALQSALDPYIGAARPIGSQQRLSAPTDSHVDPNAARAARQWAQRQGLEVPARGRVPASILEQWRNR
ncbi:histone-like nucleoid-structuring protein Lsr2 [Naasia lichenicola]|uniref:Lsr2 family protein n=1 Tax=Naasia lichenicola TaxID=2565933 RepID=A0A4S4FFA8_9MICO|nr:Lsr2 family protein [Naasia lichenicola]THG28668.1 Lsr2 family protein [Naasia lichenicola]